MAEKIRPLHLPPTSTPSQQPLLVPTSSPDGSAQHGLSVPKPQQVPGHHPQPQGSGQPDIALHARPASSSGPGTDFIVCGPGICSLHRLLWLTLLQNFSLIITPSPDLFQMEIWTTNPQ